MIDWLILKLQYNFTWLELIVNYLTYCQGMDKLNLSDEEEEDEDIPKPVKKEKKKKKKKANSDSEDDAPAVSKVVFIRFISIRNSFHLKF